MKVQISLVGSVHRFDEKVEMDVVPREGDVINIPGVSQGETVVRTVVWYPFGEDPEETDTPDTTPFVYVVVGPPRAPNIRDTVWRKPGQ